LGSNIMAEPQSPYSDPENIPMDDPGTSDDGDLSQIQTQPKSNRCSILCSWWLFAFFMTFQFVFGIACLATSAARNHDPGIAFGVLVLVFLIIFLVVHRRDMALIKFRACGRPDPQIDDNSVGRRRSVFATFASCCFTFVAFIFVLIAFVLTAIAWQSPDPSWQEFPAACPTSLHCARVAYPSVGLTLEPPSLPTTPVDVIDITRSWISSKDTNNPQNYLRTHVLLNNQTYLHARFVQGFWGFADDFAVAAMCDGNTTVFAHSQSRVSTGGSGNPDVNAQRLTEFFNYLLAVNFTGQNLCSP